MNRLRPTTWIVLEFADGERTRVRARQMARQMGVSLDDVAENLRHLVAEGWMQHRSGWTFAASIPATSPGVWS